MEINNISFVQHEIEPEYPRQVFAHCAFIFLQGELGYKEVNIKWSFNATQ